MLRSQRVPVVMPSELINVKHPFYTSPSVHREMLDDDVRTEAFRDALREVVAQYKDATVLDIGTGTGVLAIFAAQAGAKNVYGTETEGLLFDVTLQTLKRNNLDTAVQLVKYADGQKLKLPEQVDIIVSECLGHYGFDENMITAVSKCREYLKPGGTFVPSSLSLYTALVSAPDIYNDCIATWKNPRYGIDFYAVKDLALQKVYIKTFNEGSVVSDAAVLIHYALGTDAPTLQGRGRVTATKDAMIHGLVGWFTTQLSASISLSTSPYERPTHWEQVFLPIPEEVSIRKGDTIDIELTVRNHPDSNQVTFEWSLRGEADEKVYTGAATI